MHATRRPDRRITDPDAIRKFLESEDIVHIAMVDGDTPYLVPMNYGCTLTDDGKLTLHLHSAAEGRKLDILRKNPNVCFEISRKLRLTFNPQTGSCTTKYHSVIGSGKVVFVEDAQEKIESLHVLMRHAGHTDYPPFPDKLVSVTTVLRIEADEYSAKSSLAAGEEGSLL